MSKKETLFQMRNEYAKKGLEELIEYVGKRSDIANMRLIEIGSYAGESTVMFADAFKEVVSVDPFINDYDPNDAACDHADFEVVFEAFKEATANYSNISHIRKLSDDAVADFENQQFDIVYIDGDHTYDQVKKDIQNYLPLIKKGGFIAGHDFDFKYWRPVVEAVVETLGNPDAVFYDRSWIVRVN